MLLWFALFVLCGFYIGITMWTLPASVPVRFAVDGRAVGWLSRGGFIAWMLAFLLGLNILFVFIKRYAKRGGLTQQMRLPWRAYWLSSKKRQAEALQRLQEVIVMAGLMVNAAWLISYHLILQVVGQALVMEISTTFGVYMILVGALVLVYGSITYFRPP